MEKIPKRLEYTALVDETGRCLYSEEVRHKRTDFLIYNIGKDVDFVVSSDIGRSGAQNKFFHAVIVPAVAKCLVLVGMPGGDNLEFVKESILKKPYLTVNKDTEFEYVRSTSNLTVNEMWQFINFCIELLVRMGGRLEQKEQDEYMRIVRKYKLEKAMDDYLK